MLSCPFITSEVRAVTLRLLHDVPNDPGKTTSAEEGTVLRYTGCAKDYSGESAKDTSPATFFSMPYIDWGTPEPDGAADGPYSRKSLLHNFYGYRVNTGRERRQVVQKVPAGSGCQALSVSQMWYLVVGPGK